MKKLTELEIRVLRIERLLDQSLPNATKANKISIVELIQNVICDEFNVTRTYLLSEKRPNAITWPRHIAMKLAYEHSGLSTNQLAPLFNRLDHTNILHAVSRVRDGIIISDECDQQYKRCEKRVREAITKWQENVLKKPEQR